MFLLTTLMPAQTKHITESYPKTSESYKYASTFDEEKTNLVLNYLEKEIGASMSKSKYIWNRIGNIENADNEIYIELRKGVIEIKYEDKHHALNKNVIERLKKISNNINQIIN